MVIIIKEIIYNEYGEDSTTNVKLALLTERTDLTSEMIHQEYKGMIQSKLDILLDTHYKEKKPNPFSHKWNSLWSALTKQNRFTDFIIDKYKATELQFTEVYI